MSRMVCDYANPRGRQGMVWTRFPLSTRPTPPDNEDQGKGNAREDPSRRSESPYLVIPSPEDDEENPRPDWFESVSDSELNIPDEPYEGFDAGDDDDELDAMIGIPEMARMGNKSFASLLTHQMAKDLVNQVIDTGLESWEFRWMRNAGTNRQCRVGWSRLIPRASQPTSKRRCSGPKESHTPPSTSAEPNSISLSEDERGQPSQRQGELQTPLDILLGAWKSQVGQSSSKNGTTHMGNQGATHTKKKEVEVTKRQSASTSDDNVDSDEGFVFFGDYDSDRTITPRRARYQERGSQDSV